MGNIWEIDFYSRPIVDADNKKLWEVLLCESPLQPQQNLSELFRYSKFCTNQQVNSAWLKEAMIEAIAQAPQPPKKIRFFRFAMANMITKACEELGIAAQPSRRTFLLKNWLDDRATNFYPQQPGYQLSPAPISIQNPPSTPQRLPDALIGQSWVFVNLTLRELGEMPEWDIEFGEALPLNLIALPPDTPVPGILIFSPRATPLAAWMSGLDLAALRFVEKPQPQLLLETGANDSWILVNLRDGQILKEAQQFAIAKQKAGQLHFLGVQSSPEAQSFAGFWLLQEVM